MAEIKKRWEIKELVRELRRKGLSHKEIRRKIPLAKSTVSNWCKDIDRLSDNRQPHPLGCDILRRLKPAATTYGKRQQLSVSL